MNDPTRLLEALQGSPGDGSLWLALANHREEQGEVERAEQTRLPLWGRTRRGAPEKQRQERGAATDAPGLGSAAVCARTHQQHWEAPDPHPGGGLSEGFR